MLHAKFQDHSTISHLVLEKTILKVCTIHGRSGHLSRVTWTIYTNFRSLCPRRFHMKFGFDWPIGGENLLKWLTDGRTPEHAHCVCLAAQLS